MPSLPAFAGLSIPLPRARAAPSLSRSPTCLLRGNVRRVAPPAPPVEAPAEPPAPKASTSPEKPKTETSSLDRLLDRLRHINKNLRVKASAELSRLPPDETIPRLLPLLAETDTGHRRAAVQTLGMIGAPVVGPVVEQMVESDDITVRASCSKALAAVAMYFPLDREGFDGGALDTMEKMLDGGSVDPVTKIATVGCLTTLACDAKVIVGGDGQVVQGVDGEVGDGGASVETTVVAASAAEAENVITAPGNERALGMLVRMLEGSTDIALAASVSGALAQVANCAEPERKKDITEKLRKIAEGSGNAEEDEESGLSYVQEMCRNHVSQLEGNDQP